MIKPPWKREWLELTPEQFEKMVCDYLQKIGRRLQGLNVYHQSSVTGPDGEFTIDAMATFEAFGADFIVLVECKHHKNSIKREVVQVLSDKISSVRAHKGMLFSTAGFQRGAIEYALSQKITLIHFTEGGPIYETRSQDGSYGPKRPYDSYFVMLLDDGQMTYSSSLDEVEKFLFGTCDSG